VIVQPPFGLRTPDVFAAYDRTPQAAPGSSERLVDTIRALRRGDWPALGRSLNNRLEVAAATLSPWIARARAVFQQLSCIGHQLSGSGSAYFGICSHAAQAARLSAILRTRQLGMVYIVSSCS
jgi:4-diphosphocytidyl-2-C-methyl-D-erythritol kinase